MSRIISTCNVCGETFKQEHDLDMHIDIHTPYWKGKKIVISGADQIRFMLKKWGGGWKSVRASAFQHKHYQDAFKIDRIQKFEKDNKINFVLCGDVVESYRSLNHNEQN